MRLRGNSTSLPMSRRTSGSVIVVIVVDCAANGAEPLTIASAIALSVRTCRPARSAHSGAHLLLGALVERHQAHRTGGQSPLRQQMSGALGQHPGLARTGRGDHARRAARMGDRGQLIGGQIGARRVRRERQQPTVLDGNAMHHGDTVDRLGVPDRPTIEPHDRPVGKHHVAGVGLCQCAGAEGDRSSAHRPDRVIGPTGVDGVRPHQVMKGPTTRT